MESVSDPESDSRAFWVGVPESVRGRDRNQRLNQRHVRATHTDLAAGATDKALDSTPLTFRLGTREVGRGRVCCWLCREAHPSLLVTRGARRAGKAAIRRGLRASRPSTRLPAGRAGVTKLRSSAQCPLLTGKD